jgi:hydrogenase maturation protease
MKILVYGIGNTSRQDDGVGAACAERLAEWCRQEGLTEVTIRTGLQVNVEDAAAMAEAEMVLFLDASVANIDGVFLEPLTGANGNSFSAHTLSPHTVLGICRSLYGRDPEAYALHIRGVRFEVGDTITKEAEQNVATAVRTAKEILRKKIL